MRFHTWRSIAALTAVLVLASAIPLGGMASAHATGADTVTISQTPESVAVTPGSTVGFTVTLSVPASYNAPGIDVDLPAGWAVVSQRSTGTYRASEHQWVWMAGGGAETVSFYVRVPPGAAAGSYTIVATGSAVDPDTETFGRAVATSAVAVDPDSTSSRDPSTSDGGGTAGSDDRSPSTTTPTTAPPATTTPADTTPAGTTPITRSSPDRETGTDRDDAAAPDAETEAPPGPTAIEPFSPRGTGATPTATTTRSPGQPGFGIVVAAVGLVAAGLLARRRRGR